MIRLHGLNVVHVAEAQSEICLLNWLRFIQSHWYAQESNHREDHVEHSEQMYWKTVKKISFATPLRQDEHARCFVMVCDPSSSQCKMSHGMSEVHVALGFNSEVAYDAIWL